MSGEGTAQARHAAGDEGYYVRNPQTLIVVAGPFEDPADAQWEASRRNREVPLPGTLEVVLVGGMHDLQLKEVQ